MQPSSIDVVRLDDASFGDARKGAGRSSQPRRTDVLSVEAGPGIAPSASSPLGVYPRRAVGRPPTVPAEHVFHGTLRVSSVRSKCASLNATEAAFCRPVLLKYRRLNTAELGIIQLEALEYFVNGRGGAALGRSQGFNCPKHFMLDEEAPLDRERE
jgi:hypothetical protein